jgi:diaminohydroxyphosphoribosylaminopyrimidine deaminase/5-amino-6-(5-phosphoribosylamino)uracil reductase
MVTHDQTDDLLFMRRAMELAGRGRGTVSPNPLVGCVIVYHGKIIGEGWHERYGGPHAEVHAVRSVSDQSLLSQSTVYVTLEPCAHYGKTPPCADMLVAAGVRRVVISNVDPNPLVAGKGIEKLRTAGIEVSLGVQQREGLELNRRFFTMIQKQRPFIILKWAQTADGFMARTNYDSKWISNAYSRQVTHKWRTEEDAILVGTNTALRDNPQLTVRDWTGRNPTRIVIDKNMSLPSGLNLFDGTAATIRYNRLIDEVRPHEMCVNIRTDNFLPGMLADLYERKIQSLFVEGGPATLEEFIRLGLWDEVRIFIAPVRFGQGLPAPRPVGNSSEDDISGDRLVTIFPALDNAGGIHANER